MTSFTCRTCGKCWSMGPTRDHRRDAQCHECSEKEINALHETVDRLRQERLDYSSVTTTEGLNASEWIWRTGKAEREREALRAQFLDLQIQIGDLIPAVAGERANDPMINRVKRVVQELASYRADLAAAAKDLPVPLPEPGTALSQLLTANVLLKRRLEQSEKEGIALRGIIANLQDEKP